jgi:hypothetical protein
VAKRDKARKLDTPCVVRADAEQVGKEEEQDPELAALTQRMPPALLAARAQLVTACSSLRARLVALWASLFVRVKDEGAVLREERWPEAKSRLVVWMAQVRLFVSTQRDRIETYRKARADKKRRTTAPAPRVQRSSATSPGSRAEPRTPTPVEQPARGQQKPRNRRLTALALAVFGVGLGVYALAPRSGADRIRTRRPLAQVEAREQGAETAPAAAVEPVSAAVDPAPAPVVPAPIAPIPMSAVPASAASSTPISPEKLTFGAADVPNGRTFSLRMSGPVASVEGESREDGFTIRVPGRLALDRASPIATSHRAVARAMILNRGDYAELTVDFLPGLRPKYQVVGHDATLEVTLERL